MKASISLFALLSVLSLVFSKDAEEASSDKRHGMSRQAVAEELDEVSK